jgi:hypothetical protein
MSRRQKAKAAFKKWSGPTEGETPREVPFFKVPKFVWIVEEDFQKWCDIHDRRN